MGKHCADRPAKKIFFNQKPGALERRDLLNEYLENIRDKAVAEQKNKQNELDS
jgi:hypothetical protein